jgi:hypothetical protein
MDVIIYPLHVQRRLEQRWSARTVRDEPRRSPPQGTDICLCGHVVSAPSSSTYTPIGVVNEWQCSACGKHWTTTADAEHSFEKPSALIRLTSYEPAETPSLP